MYIRNDKPLRLEQTMKKTMRLSAFIHRWFLRRSSAPGHDGSDVSLLHQVADIVIPLRLASLSIVALFALHGFAQEVAVKTNIVYDAMTTPNLGMEVGLSRRSTVNLVYGLNPWTFGTGDNGERKAKHWVVQPEYRWWFCSRFNGHFVGVHALGGQFNAANVNLPIPGGFFGGENLRQGVKEHRYQGGFVGCGVTYGYQWILSRHWNLEAEAGVGYGRVWYDKFLCGECGNRLGGGSTNYAGITKLGISILYIF